MELTAILFYFNKKGFFYAALDILGSFFLQKCHFYYKPDMAFIRTVMVNFKKGVHFIEPSKNIILQIVVSQIAQCYRLKTFSLVFFKKRLYDSNIRVIGYLTDSKKAVISSIL